ncbi:nucleolar complex protein 14 [Gonapodya sp. JEL0774]|nr:nucleolar complex protein 14 [Gonapodya sp. JEL0774]
MTKSALKRLRNATTEEIKSQRKRARVNAPEESSPFERKYSKPKHAIVGRKVRGTDGKPFTARKKAYDIRQDKLLKEYQSKSRDSQFVDKRFGESNQNLSVEEKMLERFMKQRQSRDDMYNLEEEDLTHFGQSLSEMNFALPHSEDDDESDRGQIDEDTVRESHFGGFDELSHAPRSKAEVMRQVIAKSKLHKHQRQLEKEDDDTARQQLDLELVDIQQLLQTWQAERRETAARKIDRPTMTGKNSTTGWTNYDVLVHQLAADQRSQPTDRTKTAEEKERELERQIAKHRAQQLSAAKSTALPGQGDDLGNDTFEGSDDAPKALIYSNGILLNPEDFFVKGRRTSMGDSDGEFGDAETEGSSDSNEGGSQVSIEEGTEEEQEVDFTEGLDREQDTSLKNVEDCEVPEVVLERTSDIDSRSKRPGDSKLKALHKKEVKSAVRELKKDNAFLAENKFRETQDKDRKYQQKMKSIMGQLGEEQGEKKKLERLKKKR